MAEEKLLTTETQQEKKEIEITFECSPLLSYYQVSNDVSPIKRLYIKNVSGEDKENLTVNICSVPDFLIPYSCNQSVLPRKTTAKFEHTAKLSPLYMVSLDESTDGEIFVKVLQEDNVIAEQSVKVGLSAFNECNYGVNPEVIASFVKRTSEVNSLIAKVQAKLNEWNLPLSCNYSGNRNSVRNYFASCFSVLSQEAFDLFKTQNDGKEKIQSHSELKKNMTATQLELALVYASLIEANGQNGVICKLGEDWYVGVFLQEECLSETVSEDFDYLSKKSDKGVNEFSAVAIKDIVDGIAFERAEKGAKTAFKRSIDGDFIVDIKRARIMNINPMPDRVARENGYDLVQSTDFDTTIAPTQIKEFKGSVTGQKEISRVTQWERKLLDMDMRNALLNFKTSRSVVKLFVPSLEDFIVAMADNNKNYLLESKTKEVTSSYETLETNPDKLTYIKPLCDYVAYEYKAKRLITVYDEKLHEQTILKLLKKENSIQEETGTTTLYLAVGFLKWKEKEEGEDKFAPLLLYPATLAKKGIANPQYHLEVNTDDLRINSTLLEFLYQEFNIDIRGLSDVSLDSEQSILSVIARIKKETVNQKGWEIYPNVYLASLSFANYQLWYDVKYKTDKFKEHNIVNSLINNKLDLPKEAYDLSDRSSDEAYSQSESQRIYLPISADSSQYSAIYDSLNKSFVLHGPPGTGKSQTITNIIANNIARGKRVLFVAEKMAALSVVHTRLKQIGLGDFCLELHSNKTNKNNVVSHIVKTLSLADGNKSEEYDEKVQEINTCVQKLQNELKALHRKRYLGISLYQAIMGYFENQDSPDCLRIDSMFYEKLVESTFSQYIGILTELTLRAKECGNIEKSPFRHLGTFEYNERWNEEGSQSLEVFDMELKHLRQYARAVMPLFNMRTIAFTTPKLKALYLIAKTLENKNVLNYFNAISKGIKARKLVLSYKEALSQFKSLSSEYTAKYGYYPSSIDISDLARAVNGDYTRQFKKIVPPKVERSQRQTFAQFLYKCEQANQALKKRAEDLYNIFDINDINALEGNIRLVDSLYDNAQQLYADYNDEIFEDSCMRIVKYGKNAYTKYYQYAYESCARAEVEFCKVFNTSGYSGGGDLNAKIDYVATLKKNFGFIPNWCRYQEIVEKCKKSGLDFVIEPLSEGEISAEDVLSCFKKCVYYNYIRSELLLDDVLCQFSGLNLEELSARFKELSEEYERQTREELYNKLVSYIPKATSEGEQSLERVILLRAEKSNMKGMTLRNLFAKVPNIMAKCCPCMLMSPTSVTQFLDIDADKFDLVIFDEASQLPTCKAVGCIARAKNVIVVGDPKQLPPTTFFNVDYKDDEHYESEDLDSILDDCLALGMPQNHLLWHYRSLHESLIAFSNAMYYDNTLLTFPSPNELNSKVRLRYVDGIYDRGGQKNNKKEGDELIAEVIARLKDPDERKYSIGIVTFNMAQQSYIESELQKKIHAEGLDGVAYDREEPVFVKNLENVQGDERDVILFSVGYAPDKTGKLSLNFGPLNHSGGYKRLNVAVTRARNEMVVFSGITGNMIDLSRTNSKGVEGLKAFLEYAERGKEMLAISNKDISDRESGIGKLVAKELKERGILCDYNVGVSDFKIDVAVVDPKNKNKYVLAILADSENTCKLKGVKDRVTMHTKLLRKLGWNIYQLWTINYYNNPRREITKIKDFIDTLTQKKELSKKVIKDVVAKYKAPYKSFSVKPMTKVGTDFVLDIANEDKIKERIRAIIDRESPIEYHYLLDKLTFIYNIPSTAKKAVLKLSEYIASFDSLKKETHNKVFYVDKPVEFFRPSDAKVKREISKIYPEELLMAIKCAIESNLNSTRTTVIKEVITLFNIAKKTKSATEWIDTVIEDALDSKQLMITVDGVLTT